MGMAVILYSSAKPFEQIASTTSTEGSMENIVKTGKWFQRRRHLKFIQFYTCTKPWDKG